MTNDTKAPERIWVAPQYPYKAPDDYYLLDPKYRQPDKGTEYVRADIALAAQGALIERAAREAYETADIQVGEERYDVGWRDSAITIAQDIRALSPDATAALAERDERIRREEREAAAKWLFDSAAEDECPPELAKLLFHEADGIRRGLHVQDRTALTQEGEK